MKSKEQYPLPIQLAAGLIICSFVLVLRLRSQFRRGPLCVLPTTWATIFESAVQLSLQEHIPLGLVVEDEDKALCATKSPASDFENLPIKEVLNGLLKDTNSHWVLQDGVVTITPNRPEESTMRILNLKFTGFSGMKTTIQGLGIILSGFIQSTLHPEQGIAGSIPSTDSSEMIAPLYLHDVTMEQTADRIVTSGGKGIWYLRIPKSQSMKDPRQPVFFFHSYSFRDDSAMIRQLSCNAMI